MGRRLLLPDPCVADGRQQIKRHYAGKGNNMMNRQKIRGGGYYVTLDFPKTGPPNLLDEPIVVVAGIVRQKGESYV